MWLVYGLTATLGIGMGHFYSMRVPHLWLPSVYNLEKDVKLVNKCGYVWIEVSK